MTASEFDRFASTYDQDLAKALAATGESKDFFAQTRVNWVASCLNHLQAPASRVLDFGCGIGSNSPILKTTLQAKAVTGVDVSEESINQARARYASGDLSFSALKDYHPDASYDLVFTCAVFHHIPVADRTAALETIRGSLKPGGLFAFWEHNPWNPGTRYVMSQCVFDEDAVTISIPAGRKLLTNAGFQLVRTDSLFYFPRALRFLRPLERWLRAVPLGGQYLVLARKA